MAERRETFGRGGVALLAAVSLAVFGGPRLARAASQQSTVRQTAVNTLATTSPKPSTKKTSRGKKTAVNPVSQSLPNATKPPVPKGLKPLKRRLTKPSSDSDVKMDQSSKHSRSPRRVQQGSPMGVVPSVSAVNRSPVDSNSKVGPSGSMTPTASPKTVSKVIATPTQTPSPILSPFPIQSPSPSPEDMGHEIEDAATDGKMFVSKIFRSLSAEVDSLFSSRRTSYLTNKSQFRVSYTETVREYEGLTGDANLSFNLALPETERKAQLVIERKPRRLGSSDVPGEVGPAEALGDEKKSQTSATLRYFMLQAEYTHVSSDMGVQFENPIQPFMRFRVSQSEFPTEKWELRFSEEVFYFFIDRWRLVTTFDSDHTLTENLLLRFGHDLTWYQLKNGFDLVYGPSLYQKLTPTRALGYHAKYFAKNSPAWQNVNVNLSVVFRQLIFKDWLFFEIIPALDFPRTTNWHATPSFSVKIEAVF